MWNKTIWIINDLGLGKNRVALSLICLEKCIGEMVYEWACEPK